VVFQQVLVCEPGRKKEFGGLLLKECGSGELVSGMNPVSGREEREPLGEKKEKRRIGDGCWD
jgi:hypothetical protein